MRPVYLLMQNHVRVVVLLQIQLDDPLGKTVGSIAIVVLLLVFLMIVGAAVRLFQLFCSLHC